jgi:raffinose/stachyose/melibiose transport system permease protein
MNKAKKKSNAAVIVINILIYLTAFLFLAPFLISILLSVKSPQETAVNLLALPTKIHLENFVEAAAKSHFWRSLSNSLIVTGISVVIIVLASAMAGYAVGRHYKSKLMRGYEMMFMAALMLPFQSIMIPVYKMLKGFHLLNTLTGDILIISGTSLAFSIMMYIGFVKTLPMELEEAAKIEGCGDFMIFWKIVFPLLKPVTFTVATLNTLWTWNEFNVSLIVLQKDAVKTIPMQQYVFFGQFSNNYNLAFAAAVISMIPVIIFFIFSQKYIIVGLTDGAVKG